MKKRLDQNGYSASLFPTGECVICHIKSPTVRHEIFAGTRRDNSKAYGAWITVCPKCHTAIHSYPSEYRFLKREAQKRVMDAHGMSEADFISKFGKNYL